MSNKQEEAQRERCRLNFARIHPELNLMANWSVIDEELQRLLLSPTKYENYEIVLLSCGDRLARRQPTTPAPKPAPVVSAPAAVEEPPQPRVVRDPTIPDDSLPQRRPLPAEFTRGKIVSRDFPKSQTDELIRRYSRTSVLRRIDGQE